MEGSTPDADEVRDPIPGRTRAGRGVRIGQLLVEQGALSGRQVAHILRVQKATGRPFGDLAERLYGVTADAVEGAWVRQYVARCPPLDLTTIRPDAECLRLVSRRQAWQFQLLPIRRRGGFLMLATTEDALVRAVNFASRHFDEPADVYLAVADPLQMALMRHYPVSPWMRALAGRF